MMSEEFWVGIVLGMVIGSLLSSTLILYFKLRKFEKFGVKKVE